MLEILSRNHTETINLGETLATYLDTKDVVILSGELGTGKTVFARGIVKGFSGLEDLVRSPSYVYINTYKNGKVVHHIDFYLLDNYFDAIDTGFEDLLGEDLCLIEWGDKFNQLKNKEFWFVNLVFQSEDIRLIEIKAPVGKEHLLKELKKDDIIGF